MSDLISGAGQNTQAPTQRTRIPTSNVVGDDTAISGGGPNVGSTAATTGTTATTHSPNIDQLAATAQQAAVFSTPGMDRVLQASNLVDSSDPVVTSEVQSLIDRGIIHAGMSPDEIATAIHTNFTNSYTYTPDQGSDTWSRAADTIRSHSGDCEDLAIAEASILTCALQTIGGLSHDQAASAVNVVAGKEADGTGHMFVSYTDSTGVARYLESTDNGASQTSIDQFVDVHDVNFDTYFTFSDDGTTVVKLDKAGTQLQTSASSSVTISDTARNPPTNTVRDPNSVEPETSSYSPDLEGMMNFLEDNALWNMKNFNPNDFFHYQPNSLYDLNSSTIAVRDELKGMRGFGAIAYGGSWLSMTNNQLATDDDWVILDFGKMAAWQNKLATAMNLLRLLEDLREANHNLDDIAWQMLFDYQKLDESEQKSQTQDRASLINEGVSTLFSQMTTFEQKHNAAVYEIITERIANEARGKADPCKPGAEDLFKQEKGAELSAEYSRVMTANLAGMQQIKNNSPYIEGIDKIINQMEVGLTTNGGQPVNYNKGDYDGHDYVDYDSSKFVKLKLSVDLIFSVQRGQMEVLRGIEKQRNSVDEALLGVRSSEDFIDAGISEIDEKATMSGGVFSAYLNDKVTQIQQWNNMVQSNINAQKIREQMKKAQGMLIGAICLAVVCAIATVVSFGAAAPLVVGVAAFIAVAAAVGTTVLQVETMKQIKDIEDQIYQHYTVESGFGNKIRELFYGNADALDQAESELLGSVDENGYLTAASKDGAHFWEVDNTKMQGLQKQLTTLGNIRRAMIALQEMVQGLKDSVESALTGVGGYVQSGVVAAQADAQSERVSIGVQSLNYDLNDVAMARTIEDNILKRKNELDSQINTIIRDGAISIGVTVGLSFIGLGVLKLIKDIYNVAKLASALANTAKIMATLGSLASFSWSLGTMIGQIMAERSNLDNPETGFLHQHLSGKGAITRIFSENVQNTGELMEMDSENALADALSDNALIDGGNDYKFLNTELFKSIRTRLDHVAKMRIAQQMIMGAQQELVNIADATLLGFSKNRAGVRLASSVIQAVNQSDFSRLDEIKTFKTKEAAVINRTVDAARQMKTNTMKLALTISIGVVGLGLSAVGGAATILGSIGNLSSKAGMGMMIAGNVSMMFALAMNNLGEGIINATAADSGNGDLAKITREMDKATVSRQAEDRGKGRIQEESMLDSHIAEGADIVDSALSESIISNSSHGYWAVDTGQLAALNTRIERMARVEKLLTKIMEREQSNVSMAWRQTTGGGLNTEGASSVNSVIDINKQSLQSRLQLNFDRLQSIVDRHNKKLELQNAAITNFILMGIAIALAAVSAGAQIKSAGSSLGQASKSGTAAWTNANMVLATLMNLIRGYMGFFVQQDAGNRSANKKAGEQRANDRATHGAGRLSADDGGASDGEFSGFDFAERADMAADTKAGRAKVVADQAERQIQINQEYLQATRDLFEALAQQGSEMATVKIGAKLTMATGKLAITRRQGVSDEVSDQILRSDDNGTKFLAKALRRDDNRLEGLQNRNGIIAALESPIPEVRLKGLAMLSEAAGRLAQEQQAIKLSAPTEMKTTTSETRKAELKQQFSHADETAYNAELLSNFANLALGKVIVERFSNPKTTSAQASAVDQVLSDHPQAGGQALAARMGHIDQGWGNNPFDLFTVAVRAVRDRGDMRLNMNMSQKQRLEVLTQLDQSRLRSDQKDIIVGQVVGHMPLDVWNMIKNVKNETPVRNSGELARQMQAFAMEFVISNTENAPHRDLAKRVAQKVVANLQGASPGLPTSTQPSTVKTAVNSALDEFSARLELSPTDRQVLETGLTSHITAVVQAEPTNLAARLTAQFVRAATPEQALELLHKISSTSGRQSLVHERDLPSLVAKAAMVSNQTSYSAKNLLFRGAEAIGSVFSFGIVINAANAAKRGIQQLAGADRDRSIATGILDPKKVMASFVTRYLHDNVDEIAAFVDKMKGSDGRDKYLDQLALLDHLSPQLRQQVANQLGLSLAGPADEGSVHSAALLQQATQNLLLALEVLHSKAAESRPTDPALAHQAAAVQQPVIDEVRELAHETQRLALDPSRATPAAIRDVLARINVVTTKAKSAFPTPGANEYDPVELLTQAAQNLNKAEASDAASRRLAAQLISQVASGTNITAERVANTALERSENPERTVAAFAHEARQRVKSLLDAKRQGQPLTANEKAEIKRLVGALAMMGQTTGLSAEAAQRIGATVNKNLREIMVALVGADESQILLDARSMLNPITSGDLSISKNAGLATLISAAISEEINLVNPAGEPPINPAMLAAMPTSQLSNVMAALSQSPEGLELARQAMAQLTTAQVSDVMNAMARNGQRRELLAVANACKDQLFVAQDGTAPTVTDSQLRRLLANPKKSPLTGPQLLPGIKAAFVAGREAQKMIRQLERALTVGTDLPISVIESRLVALSSNVRINSSGEYKGQIDSVLSARVRAISAGNASGRDAEIVTMLARQSAALGTLLGPNAQCLSAIHNIMTSTQLASAELIIDGIDRTEDKADRKGAIDAFVKAVTSANREALENAIQAAQNRVERSRTSGIETHADEVLLALIAASDHPLNTACVEKAMTVVLTHLSDDPVQRTAALTDLNAAVRNGMAAGGAHAAALANMARSANPSVRGFAGPIAASSGIPYVLMPTAVPPLEEMPVKAELSRLGAVGDFELAANLAQQYFSVRSMSVNDRAAYLENVGAFAPELIAEYLTRHCSPKEAGELLVKLSPDLQVEVADRMASHFDSAKHLTAMLTRSVTDQIDTVAMMAVLAQKDVSPRLALTLAPATNITEVLARLPYFDQQSQLLDTLAESGQMSGENLAHNVAALEAHGLTAGDINGLVENWMQSYPETAKLAVPHLHEKYLSSAYRTLSDEMADAGVIPAADRRAIVMINAEDPVHAFQSHLAQFPAMTVDEHEQLGIDLAHAALTLAAGDSGIVSARLNALLEDPAVPMATKEKMAQELVIRMGNDADRTKMVTVLGGMSPLAMGVLAQHIATLFAAPAPPSNTQILAWMSTLSQLPTFTPCHDVLSNPAGGPALIDAVSGALVSGIIAGKTDAAMIGKIVCASPHPELFDSVLGQTLQPAFAHGNFEPLANLRQQLTQALVGNPNRSAILRHAALQVLGALPDPPTTRALAELSKWVALLPEADQADLIAQPVLKQPALVAAYLQIHLNETGILPLGGVRAQLRQAAEILLRTLPVTDLESAAKLGLHLSRAGESNLTFVTSLGADRHELRAAFAAGNSNPILAELPYTPMDQLRCLGCILSLSLFGNEGLPDPFVTQSTTIAALCTQMDAVATGLYRSNPPADVREQMSRVLTPTVNAMANLLRHSDSDPAVSAQVQTFRNALLDDTSAVGQAVVGLVARGVSSMDANGVRAAQNLVSALPDGGRAEFVARIELEDGHFDTGSVAFRELVTLTPDAAERPAAPGNALGIQEGVQFVMVQLPAFSVSPAERRQIRDRAIEEFVPDPAVRAQLTAHFSAQVISASGAVTTPNENALTHLNSDRMVSVLGASADGLSPSLRYKIQAVTELRAMARSMGLSPDDTARVNRTIAAISAVDPNQPDHGAITEIATAIATMQIELLSDSTAHVDKAKLRDFRREAIDSVIEDRGVRSALLHHLTTPGHGTEDDLLPGAPMIDGQMGEWVLPRAVQAQIQTIVALRALAEPPGVNPASKAMLDQTVAKLSLINISSQDPSKPRTTSQQNERHQKDIQGLALLGGAMVRGQMSLQQDHFAASSRARRREIRNQVIGEVVRDTTLKTKLTAHLDTQSPAAPGMPATRPHEDALMVEGELIPDFKAGNDNHFLTPELQHQIQVLTTLRAMLESPDLDPAQATQIQLAITQLNGIEFSTLRPLDGTATVDTPAQMKLREKDLEATAKMSGILTELRLNLGQQTGLSSEIDALMPVGNMGAQMRAVLRSESIADTGPESQTRFTTQMANRLGDGIDQVSSTEALACLTTLLEQTASADPAHAQKSTDLFVQVAIRLMNIRSEKVPQLFALLDQNPSASAVVRPQLAAKIKEQIDSELISDPALFMLQGYKRNSQASLTTRTPLGFSTDIRNAGSDSFNRMAAEVFGSVSPDKRAHMMAAFIRIDRGFADRLIESMPGMQVANIGSSPAAFAVAISARLAVGDRVGAQAIIREFVRSGTIPVGKLRSVILAAFPVPPSPRGTATPAQFAAHRDRMMELAQLVNVLQDLEGVRFSSNQRNGFLRTTDIAGAIIEDVKRSDSPDRLVFDSEVKRLSVTLRDEPNRGISHFSAPPETATEKGANDWIIAHGRGNIDERQSDPAGDHPVVRDFTALAMSALTAPQLVRLVNQSSSQPAETHDIADGALRGGEDTASVLDGLPELSAVGRSNTVTDLFTAMFTGLSSDVLEPLAAAKQRPQIDAARQDGVRLGIPVPRAMAHPEDLLGTDLSAQPAWDIRSADLKQAVSGVAVLTALLRPEIRITSTSATGINSTHTTFDAKLDYLTDPTEKSDPFGHQKLAVAQSILQMAKADTLGPHAVRAQEVLLRLVADKNPHISGAALDAIAALPDHLIANAEIRGLQQCAKLAAECGTLSPIELEQKVADWTAQAATNPRQADQFAQVLKITAGRLNTPPNTPQDDPATKAIVALRTRQLAYMLQMGASLPARSRELTQQLSNTLKLMENSKSYLSQLSRGVGETILNLKNPALLALAALSPDFVPSNLGNISPEQAQVCVNYFVKAASLELKSPNLNADQKRELGLLVTKFVNNVPRIKTGSVDLSSQAVMIQIMVNDPELLQTMLTNVQTTSPRDFTKLVQGLFGSVYGRGSAVNLEHEAALIGLLQRTPRHTKAVLTYIDQLVEPMALTHVASLATKLPGLSLTRVMLHLANQSDTYRLQYVIAGAIALYGREIPPSPELSTMLKVLKTIPVQVAHILDGMTESDNPQIKSMAPQLLYLMSAPPNSDYEGAAQFIANMDYYNAVQVLNELQANYPTHQVSAIMAQLSAHQGQSGFPNTDFQYARSSASQNPMRRAVAELEEASLGTIQTLRLPEGATPTVVVPAEQSFILAQVRLGKVSDDDLANWMIAQGKTSPEMAAITLIQLQPDQVARLLPRLEAHDPIVAADILKKIDSHAVRMMRPAHFNEVLNTIIQFRPQSADSPSSVTTTNRSVGKDAVARKDLNDTIDYFGMRLADMQHLFSLHFDRLDSSKLPSNDKIQALLRQGPLTADRSVTAFNQSARSLFLALQEMDQNGFLPPQLPIADLVREGITAAQNTEKAVPADLITAAVTVLNTATTLHPHAAANAQGVAQLTGRLAELSLGDPDEFAALVATREALPDQITAKNREITAATKAQSNPPTPAEIEALDQLKAELADLQDAQKANKADIAKKIEHFGELAKLEVMSPLRILELATGPDKVENRLINHLPEGTVNRLLTRHIHANFESDPAGTIDTMVHVLSRMKDRASSTLSAIKTVQTELAKYAQYSQYSSHFERVFGVLSHHISSYATEPTELNTAIELLDKIATSISAASKWSASQLFTGTCERVAQKLADDLDSTTPATRAEASARIALLAQKSEKIGYRVFELVKATIGPDKTRDLLTTGGQTILQTTKSEKIDALNAMITQKFSVGHAEISDISFVLQQLPEILPTDASRILTHIGTTLEAAVAAGQMEPEKAVELMQGVIKTITPNLEKLAPSVAYLHTPPNATKPILVMHLERLAINANDINPMLTSRQNLENHVLRAMVSAEPPAATLPGPLQPVWRGLDAVVYQDLDDVSVANGAEAPVKIAISPQLKRQIDMIKNEPLPDPSEIPEGQTHAAGVDHAMAELTMVQSSEQALAIIKALPEDVRGKVVEKVFKGPASPIQTKELTLKIFQTTVASQYEDEDLLRQVIELANGSFPSIYKAANPAERRIIIQALVDLEGPKSEKLSNLVSEKADPELARFTRFEVETRVRVHVVQMSQLDQKSKVGAPSIADSTPVMMRKLTAICTKNPDKGALAIAKLYKAARSSKTPEKDLKKLGMVLMQLLTLHPSAGGSALIKLPSGIQALSIAKEVFTGREASVKHTSLPVMLAEIGNQNLIETVFMQVFPSNAGRSQLERAQNELYQHATLFNIVSSVTPQNAKAVLGALGTIFESPGGRAAKNQLNEMFLGRNAKRDTASQHRLQRLIGAAMDKQGKITVPFVKELVETIAAQNPQLLRTVMKPEKSTEEEQQLNLKMAKSLWEGNKFTQLGGLLNISAASKEPPQLRLLGKMAKDGEVPEAMVGFVLANVQKKVSVVSKAPGQTRVTATGRRTVTTYRPDPERVQEIIAGVKRIPNPDGSGRPNAVAQVIEKWEPLFKIVNPDQFGKAAPNSVPNLHEHAFDLSKILSSSSGTTLTQAASGLAAALVTEPDTTKAAYLVAQINQSPELAQEFQTAVRIILSAGSPDMKTAAAVFQTTLLPKATELTPVSEAILGNTPALKDGISQTQEYAKNQNYWAEARHFAQNGVANEQELYRILNDGIQKFTSDLRNMSQVVLQTARQGITEVVQHGGLGSGVAH